MIIKAYAVPHPPIIFPEVGRGEEEKIRKTIDSMEKMAREIASLKPDTIVITSPHAPAFRDGFFMESNGKVIGNFHSFGIGNVEEIVETDRELGKEIEKLGSKLPIVYSNRYSSGMDHGTLIPVRFIHKYYKDFKVVILGLSGLGEDAHFELGKIIDQSIRNLNRKAIFIGSGDLSHVLKSDGPYGYKTEGPEFDEKIVEILKNSDFKSLFNFSKNLVENAAQCGLNSFQIMAGALDSYEVENEFYTYEGPFGVGYGVFGFDIIKELDPYVKLAKNTIEEFISYRRKIELPEDLPEEMIENKAGTFVTLYKNGELRGCIGTIFPTTNSIGEEIIQNAISACIRDPRFPPVKESELKELVISVDVLRESEKIESLSELDTNRYGIIVSSGYKKGLLLPNIEGIDEAEAQVDIALRKAGISKFEEYEMERFEVIRHE